MSGQCLRAAPGNVGCSSPSSSADWALQPKNDLTDELREDVVKRSLGIVREAGMRRRWLDHRARGRDEPVETLGPRELRDRTSFRIARDDPSNPIEMRL